MFVDDYVLNGKAHGEVGSALQAVRYEPSLMRPYVNRAGQCCVDYQTGLDKHGKPVYKPMLVRDAMDRGLLASNAKAFVNNATTLRKDEWLRLDQVVVRAGRSRLRAWSDLMAASSFGGFDGMSKTILEWETMSDPGEAVVDMDGLSEERGDQPRYQLEGLPLPITHSGFHFSLRKLSARRNTGTPLDTTMAEACSRRVSEMIEKTLIGTVTGITYGVATDYNNTPTVYGYTNHPDRNTKTDLTTPDGTNGATTLEEVLSMINTLRSDNFYGPYVIYHSTDWDTYMDDDYRAQDSRTLRERLRAIDEVQDVRRLDFLTNTFTLLIVQLSPEVARAVNGMDIQLVQWESSGGLRLEFKVMAIQVPQLRSDFNGNCGIMHGTTS